MRFDVDFECFECPRGPLGTPLSVRVSPGAKNPLLLPKQITEITPLMSCATLTIVVSHH